MQKSESQPQSSWKNFPTDTEGVVGFVYLIRNNHPDSKKKYYIGQKKMLKKVKRKPLKGKTRNRISYVDNDVEKYWGSSKELLTDIEKYGIEYFSKEVIEVCYSKFHMTYGELIWQIKCNALMDQRYYNGILSCRISRIPKDYIDIDRNIDTLNL